MSSSLRNYQKTVIKAIGEVLLIIIGILGAFAIEDWQQNKKQQKLLKDTLNITMVELANNYCELVKGHKHQNRVRNILSEGLPKAETKDDQIKLYSAIYSIGIWQPATLMSTAWDTAIATGAIRNIPLKDATILAQFYHDAKRYNDKLDVVTNEMIKSDYTDMKLLQFLKGVAGSNDSLWWFEKKQLNRYDQHFAQLAKQYGYEIKKCEE